MNYTRTFFEYSFEDKKVISLNKKDFHHEINVFTGLEPKTQIPSAPPGQGDGHMRGFMVALTGDRPEPESFDHSSHTLTANRATLPSHLPLALPGEQSERVY